MNNHKPEILIKENHLLKSLLEEKEGIIQDQRE